MQGKITQVDYPEANKNANMRSNTRYEKNFFLALAFASHMFEPGQNKHNMKNTGSYFTKKLSQISSHLKNSLVWKDVTREVGLCFMKKGT